MILEYKLLQSVSCWHFINPLDYFQLVSLTEAEGSLDRNSQKSVLSDVVSYVY